MHSTFIQLDVSAVEKSNMHVEAYKWLGIVYPDDVKPNRVLITPIAFFNGDSWLAVSRDDSFNYFRNNGKVVLFTDNFPNDLKSQLCSFIPVKNPYLQNIETPNHSLYQIKDIRELTFARLTQVINWTNKATTPFEVPELLNRGIEQKDCVCKTVYIKFQDYLYGPIKLERIDELLKPREFKGLSTGGEKLFVSVYPLLEKDILSLNGISSHLEVLDEDKLKSPLRQIDWSLPQVVIKQVLLASNTISQQLEGDVRLVDRRVRELARLSSSEGSPALHIYPETLERAQYIVEHQSRLLGNLKMLIEGLGPEHPLIEAARELIIETESEKIKLEVQERIPKDLRQAQQEVETTKITLVHLEKNIEDAKLTLAHLQANIDEAMQKREQVQGELRLFESEINQQLLQLQEKPIQVLAQLQVATPLLKLLKDTYRTPNARAETVAMSENDSLQTISPSNYNDSSFPWLAHNMSSTFDVSLEKSRTLIKNVARQQSIRLKSLQVAFAALLAGLIPVLDNTIAISLLDALGQLLAYGRRWTIPIPLTALSPLDLFGSIDIERHTFVPSVGGLADIVLQARKHPNDLGIILLEGVDRVPAMPVIIPLFRAYLESQQSKMYTAPINLFHPRALTHGDPYEEIAKFVWPANLFLAVTCDNDVSSLSLPSMCNPWLSRFESNLNKMQRPKSQPERQLRYVSSKLWQQWRQSIYSEEQNESNRALNYQQQAFCEALKMLGVSDDIEKIAQHVWPEQFEEEE